jgi:hypothetical protein
MPRAMLVGACSTCTQPASHTGMPAAAVCASLAMPEWLICISRAVLAASWFTGLIGDSSSSVEGVRGQQCLAAVCILLLSFTQ